MAAARLVLAVRFPIAPMLQLCSWELSGGTVEVKSCTLVESKMPLRCALELPVPSRACPEPFQTHVPDARGISLGAVELRTRRPVHRAILRSPSLKRDLTQADGRGLEGADRGQREGSDGRTWSVWALGSFFPSPQSNMALNSRDRAATSDSSTAFSTAALVICSGIIGYWIGVGNSLNLTRGSGGATASDSDDERDGKSKGKSRQLAEDSEDSDVGDVSELGQVKAGMLEDCKMVR